jgi:glycine/D-amino acid oxidase-like deaminating enzyme
MKIAILGAGVAGVASAIALKLKGHDVTVYERRDADANIGALDKRSPRCASRRPPGSRGRWRMAGAGICRCKYNFGVPVNPCIPRQTRRKYL